MINVTKTYLPNKLKYLAYVDKIYSTGWVTNRGPLVRELEEKLAVYLGVNNLILVANGTVALEVAYRLLELKNEVITTPFSFVATTSSLVANGLTPVFADINSKSLNLNPDNIESAISEHTSAIVPTHVFGNACEVEKIKNIAYKHNIKVIYDGAHAFGANYKGQSLLNNGDITTLSFHATKLFHTIEGGALVIQDENLMQEARFLINFGIDGVDSVKALGTNAKMNEFEAAMGLCILEDMNLILEKRREVHDLYFYSLKNCIELQAWNKNSEKNYGYFPIIFDSQEKTLHVKKALNKIDVWPRRYFYPSLDTLPYIERKKIMRNSRDIASRILCLPIHPSLDRSSQKKIIKTIVSNT